MDQYNETSIQIFFWMGTYSDSKRSPEFNGNSVNYNLPHAGFLKMDLGRLIMKMKVLVAESRPTLRPHGLWPLRFLCPWDSQARTLEGVAISFSGDLPDPGIKPTSPALQADSLPPESPEIQYIYIHIPKEVILMFWQHYCMNVTFNSSDTKHF